MSEHATGNYQVAKPAPLSAFKGSRIGNLAYENALSASSGARKQLQRIVQSATRRRRKVTDRGHRLDPSRMTQAVFGEPNVFVNRGRKLSKDTAFHLLIDASPSMNQRIRLALEATIALGLALERIQGVNLAISRFPIDGKINGVLYDDDVQPLIRHGERIANNLNRFDIDTMGGTPMANAMWYCYSQLVQQKSPRRILFVVTDGEPSNKPAVFEALQWAQSVGIETMGLGIKAKTIETIFPGGQNIDDVHELESALFTMTRDALTQVA